jgi:Baseplate J-like protein
MSYQYLLSTGAVVPDTSDLLSEVQTSFKSVFGAGLNVNPSTPQGCLITALTLARSSVVNNNAALANQINPNIAGGTFLDAIMALTGAKRVDQTQTSVTNVTVSGVPGTTIPEGSQAQTAAGDIFASLEPVTLPSGGSTTVNFASVEYGAIACAENALNVISAGGALGWETVNNGASSVTTLGQTTQADQAARTYRQNTLGFQGLSLAAAITAALYATPGVTSLKFQENIAATTAVINSITMVPHSVYACVEGGSNVAIAAALLENKSSGAAWNGQTSQSVVEPASGQTYTVLFDRPTPIGILCTVISPNGNEANVVQAILDYAAGLVEIIDQNGVTQTLPGFVVGGSVSPFVIAGAIMAENPGIILTSVEIGLAPSGSQSATVIPVGVNQIATIIAGNITVNPS